MFVKKIFLTLVVLFGSLYVVQHFVSRSNEEQLPVVVNMPEVEEAVKMEEQVEESQFQLEDATPLIDLSQVNSTSVILTELGSDEVIAEKNSKVKLYPASLTKIMTAIVAIELVDDLDKTVVMDAVYFEDLLLMDATVAGFQVDEIVRFRDLLYGAILPSGADACLAIAYLLAGSEEAYVDLMNEKATEMGLEDTHFTNVTGLHDPYNYSSVQDLSQLLHDALANEDFFAVFTTKEYSTAPTNLNPEGVKMLSSVFRHTQDYPMISGLVIGGKTGFTEEAGLCLATLAQIDGVHYLLVTAGAGAQPEGAGPNYVDIIQPLHVMDAALIYPQLQ